MWFIRNICLKIFTDNLCLQYFLSSANCELWLVKSNKYKHFHKDFESINTDRYRFVKLTKMPFVFEQEFMQYREKRGKMLLSRRNQLLLEFSFWNEPVPRDGPNIYELRSYQLRVWNVTIYTITITIYFSSIALHSNIWPISLFIVLCQHTLEQCNVRCVHILLASIIGLHFKMNTCRVGHRLLVITAKYTTCNSVQEFSYVTICAL